MPDYTTEPFQTAGTLDAPTKPAWAAVARDADGQVLRVDGATVRSGGHTTEQDAVDAVTHKLTNHTA